MTKPILRLILIAAAALAHAKTASASEVKVLTAGAMRAVVDDLLPAFEKQSGHKVSIDNATAGALAKRIEAGEAFDVAIITPKVVEELVQRGRIASGSRT